MIGAALVWLTYSLGQWQTARAKEKHTLFDAQSAAFIAAPVSPTNVEIDVDNLSYRKIELMGSFDAKALIYIDNRQVNGRPAVQVVQGFRPQGASYLIPVDRGFLLRDPAKPRIAPQMPQAGFGELIQLRGTILPRFAQSAELQGIQLGAVNKIYREESNGYSVWSNFSADEFEKRFGLPVANYVVTLQAVLQREGMWNEAYEVNGFYHWVVPLQDQVAKHKGYAFQWFGMSAACMLLTLLFVYREFYKGNKE
jgi:cytochrome oxidase assembly protein ShyY1